MSSRFVVLRPRDGMFLKDGRGWHTSASGRGRGLHWPFPSTLRGALCTAIGRAREGLSGRPLGAKQWQALLGSLRLGTTLALRRTHTNTNPWSTAHRCWPVPADALYLAGGPEQKILRRSPQPPRLPTLGRDDDEAREALWRPPVLPRGKPDRGPRWWTEAQLIPWLCGGVLTNERVDTWVEPTTRIDVHVAIDRDAQTAADALLYANDVTEPFDKHGGEWAIGCELQTPDDDLGRMLTLGADRRPASIEVIDRSLLEMPESLRKAFERAKTPRFALMAVTPVENTHGWVPEDFVRVAAADGTLEYRGVLSSLPGRTLKLRAAYIPRATAVSGWDMVRRQPKPTSRLAPPGSMWFFETTDGRALTPANAQSLWLASIGRETESGYGRVLPGVWSMNTPT